MHTLTVDNVSFNYDPAIPTLRDISLTVAQGEFVSLVGPNGSGKTTLLRLLDRIYIPQKGHILLAGKSLLEYSRLEIARRIAFVPQEAGPIFPFTVLEIVLMGRSPHTRGMAFESPHDREIAREMMKLTDVDHLASHPVTALSGGERQRVFLARALAQQPEIILLDEPNAHLDIAHQLDIFGILRRLATHNRLTVVSVSHDLNLAASFSDRVAMLLCGSLAAVGTPDEVLTEDRIGEVFRTRVLVDKHPMNASPRITLLTSN
jgi:iron complex transport system ATP-binding protein